ncbi:MAG: AMP-binding protein [Acidimicrobiia bacterium]|nr:AMP-binding protein [Acidimicrobiia bacterium]
MSPARERHEMILADLIALRAEEQPELDVLTFEHLSLDGGATPDAVRTYADLAEHAQRIAAGLVELDMVPGDRFAIMMRNHPEFVETMIAASITGTVFVPIDPRTRGDKLAYMLTAAGCKGLVTSDDCLGEIDRVRGRLPDLGWILALDTGDDTGELATAPWVRPLGELLEHEVTTLDVRAPDPEAPLQIMFTSGTTGDPKGIVGSNLRFCGAALLGHLFDYGPDDRPYTGLSLTHGNAQSVTLAPALHMGLRAVFSRRFTRSKLWDVCRAHGCTTFSLLGGIATAIYSEPPRPNDADNPVRMVVSGGMPAGLWKAFEDRFDVRVLEFYGAMDGGGVAYKPIGEGPIGSFGKPMGGVEMKILDEEGIECPPGVIGEICSRPEGGEATIDYHGDPEASRRKIRSGWNRSGDMGHCDAEGWMFFDFRAGGGIRRNGEFVNAGFVEKAIAEHPAVGDVFVYGVPAASGAPGESDIVAAVVAAPGASLDLDEVFVTCRSELEANFVPTYLQQVDEIPKTASEKPLASVLSAALSPDADNVRTEA